MTKYLALAIGAALAATATFSYAQTTPPSTDRPSGVESGGTSAKPDMDKKKGTTDKSAPKAGGTPTPPSTDRPSGVESGGTSAKPNPDKK
jgi:hypothetical protein